MLAPVEKEVGIMLCAEEEAWIAPCEVLFWGNLCILAAFYTGVQEVGGSLWFSPAVHSYIYNWVTDW